MSEGSAPAGELPGKPTILYFVLACLTLGVGVAVFLVHHKVGMSGLIPGYQSACAVSATIDCDAVNTSRWSMLFGLPVALYAIPTYLLMAWLIKETLVGMKAEDRATRAAGRLALVTASSIAAASVLMSLYMGYIASVHIGKICQYCITLYAVSIASAGLLAYAAKTGPIRALSETLHGLADMKAPMGPAIGVLLIAGGVSWATYDMYVERLEADKMALIDAQFADAFGDPDAAEPVAVPPATPARAALGAAPATAGSPTASAPVAPTVAAGAAAVAARPPAPAAAATPPSAAPAPGPAGARPTLMDPRSGVRKGKKTENGWTWFEAPLAANEFWYGKADSPVTVVKFADFECSYCKLLASSFKPVKEKYKDRVRFVMKQFPMNPKCNRYMAGYDKHPNACEAAYAGYCAGVQGKFWEMHEVLYANQDALDVESLKGHAAGMGLNRAAFDACLVDPQTVAAIKNDIEIGIAAGINGTPKTYVGNRLVTGSATRSILEYYIDKALEAAAKSGAGATGAAGVAAAAPAAVVAPKPDGTQMIAARTAGGAFYIDPYEAVVAADGRAVAMPGVEPAQVSWFDAKAACEKAGKRLCTEEEWMSACTGVPAVDDNNNGWFSDDTVEGGMYPYGAFHGIGACQDDADKYSGRALAAGSKPKCRTASGIFDQPGNIGEWVNPNEGKATLMGGNASSGERAACNQRSYGSGAGRRNHTTGFRCCADTNVTRGAVDEAALKETVTELLGAPVPAFTATDSEGKPVSSAAFKGKVTLVNFFASWCGPCKKEMPYLVKYQDTYRAQGFQIIGIGTDGLAEKSVEFAKGYEVNYPIVTDPDSVLMGKFTVHSMPATFLVDKQGVVRFKDTGFKPAEQADVLERKIKELLAKP